MCDFLLGMLDFVPDMLSLPACLLVDECLSPCSTGSSSGGQFSSSQPSRCFAFFPFSVNQSQISLDSALMLPVPEALF